MRNSHLSSFEKDFELDKTMAQIDININVVAQVAEIEPIIYDIEDLRKKFKADND